MSHSSEGRAGKDVEEQTTAIPSESHIRYSVDHLLELRSSLPFVLFNLDTLSANAETSTILNLPQEAKVNKSFSIRTSELARMQSRPLLASRGGNGFTRHGAGSGSLGGGEVAIDYKGHPSRDTREMEAQRDYNRTSGRWRVNSRDTSDRSSQPLEATPGLLVNKNENFKKFIDAVTSPPHVRVTAGGRVVINTRAPRPPPRGPVFQVPSPEEPEPFYQQGVPLTRADLRGQGIFTPGSNHYFGAPMSAQVSGDTVDSNTSEETPQLAAIGETSAKPQPAIPPPGIQISPIENFDVTKPFWYGDRWIYPQGYPQGSDAPAHALPLNYQGNPAMMQHMYGYMPGHFPGQGGQPMFYPPPNNTLGGMLPPGQPLQYASLPSMMYAGQQPLGNIANGTPVGQASLGGPQFGPQFVGHGPQMAPFHEDPRERMARLREELRKIENDIMNNSHQIHMPSKTLQRNHCLADIQRLEAVLSLEMSSRDHRVPSFTKVSNEPVRKGSSSMFNENAMIDNMRKPVVVDSSSTASNSVIHTTVDKGGRAKNSSAEQETTEVARGQEPQVDASSLQDKKRSRDRLAAAAATATFEPRPRQLSELQNPGPSDMHRESADINAMKARAQMKAQEAENKASEARLLSHAVDWSVPASMNSSVNLGPSAPYSHIGLNRFRQNQGPSMPQPTMQQQRMYPYMPAQAPAPFRGPADLHMTGAPYLRGTKHMGNGEYLYDRQLTDDERRARCLYWGKASRELQRGLPKYNGKDFYPPSPAKATMRSSRSSREQTGEAQVPDPFRDVDYSRTNQGVTKDDADDGGSPSSLNSWGQRSLKHVKSDLAPGHTLPRMSPSKREARSPYTDKVHTGFEEDRSTLASDRLSIDTEKRSMAENRAPPSILRNMLKGTRVSNNASSDSKEVSSESLGHSLEGKHWLSRSSAASMAAPLSGTITSATARGFLPQYRGTASASLAPTAESPDRLSSMFARFSHADAQDQLTNKAAEEDETNFANNRHQGGKKASSSRLAAADYLRTVANRDQRENQKNSQSFSRRSGYDASNMGGDGF